MSPETFVLLSGALTFGAPMLFALRELRDVRRRRPPVAAGRRLTRSWYRQSRSRCRTASSPSSGRGCASLRMREAGYSAAWANGRPVSIGSAGSRLHSFHEPKYMRTSVTPAALSATRVLDARAPLKQ